MFGEADFAMRDGAQRRVPDQIRLGAAFVIRHRLDRHVGKAIGFHFILLADMGEGNRGSAYGNDLSQMSLGRKQAANGRDLGFGGMGIDPKIVTPFFSRWRTRLNSPALRFVP